MIAVEGHGVPTATFTARHFVEDARLSAEHLGLSELPLAVVAKPFTNQEPDEIRAQVGTAVSQVEAGLSRQPVAESHPARRPSEREAIEGTDLLDCSERFDRLFLERGWSDGLPLVPPTPGRVERMLACGGLAPQTVICEGLYPGQGIATAEKIAINGVMAGCRPEHTPVLMALVRAYEALGFLGKTQAMSTGPNAPLVLVSGPITKRLGFNSGTCVAGPGSPSYVNTVIGRALRLILMNIGHAYPGKIDMDTIGTPNKYSFCLAENEERTPWTPWSVQKGFPKDTSTLSIALVYPGHCLCDFAASRPEELLDTLVTLTASYIGCFSVGRWLFGGWQDPATKKIWPERHVLLLAPSHAALIAQHGWSRTDVQQYIYDKSRIPFRLLYSNAVKPQSAALKAAHPELSWLLDQPETRVSISEAPDCFEVFVTGGDAGRSQFHYGGSDISTVAIQE